MKNNIRKRLIHKEKLKTSIIINTEDMNLKLDGINVKYIEIKYMQFLHGSKFKYLTVYNLADNSKWIMDKQLHKRV